PRSTCHHAPWGFSLSPDQKSPGEYSLRLIDPIFSKLGRPFGQFALAVSTLLRRNCWVFNLFKRPFSEPHCTGGLQSRTRARFREGRVQPLQRRCIGGISLRGFLSSPLAVLRQRPKLTRKHAVSHFQGDVLQRSRYFQIFLAQHAASTIARLKKDTRRVWHL